MTLTKIKFSNAGRVPDDSTVTVLPCKGGVDYTHRTNDTSCSINYRFDDSDTSLPLMLHTETWYSVEDIDELILFLKGVKKRVAKVAEKRTAARGF